MVNLILQALVLASITFTISVTSIFAPLREVLSKVHPKLEELIHCPYCLSHYVGAVLLLCTHSYYHITQWSVFNFLFTLFVIVAISALVHYVLLRAYEPVARNMMHRELERLKLEEEIYE